VAGIASFRFDYRCHGRSDLPIEAMTLSGIVNDIQSAAEWACVHAQPSHLHVVGMSFGGGLSAFWASRTRLAVASVVMLAPVIDYVEDVLGQHGSIDGGKLSKSAAKRLETDGFIEADGFRYGPALINELPIISGIEGLRLMKCPSLILHGDADSIVPYASSERFVKLNSQSRLINIPGTDHGFGVGDDEDLSSPETKDKHRDVFRIISRFYTETAQYER
jgi:pimeloyl-ACP methyl ester carboxylesterase